MQNTTMTIRFSRCNAYPTTYPSLSHLFPLTQPHSHPLQQSLNRFLGSLELSMKKRLLLSS